MRIRDATTVDWPAIWTFMREIIAAGDTFSWDPEIGEEQAKGIWLAPPPHQTLAAVDDDDRVLGSAILGPNHGGPGAHVATASFMADPAQAGRGVGRALGEAVIARAAAAGYRAMQFNAVVETNVRALHLWRSLGFEVLATIPEAFAHPEYGYVGLCVMYRRL
jgi:L-amino acid N-acyltransferase YncA